MMISSLLALWTAASSAAELPPAAALEKVAEIPSVAYRNDGFSPDSTLYAASGETSLGVWRLEDGHQLARIALPPVEKIDKDDVYGFWVSDVSPDNRSLLLNYWHNRDWKKGEYGVYLVSLDDEKIRPLLIERKNCRHQQEEKPSDINPTICPSAEAFFSPDARKILIKIEGGPERIVYRTKPFLVDYEAVVVGLDGKVQKRLKETFRQDPIDANYNWPPLVALAAKGARASGFRRDGTLVGVVQDESSCELRDLYSGKRLGFLDGCNRADKLELEKSGSGVGVAWDVKSVALKRWDLTTGKVTTNAPCPACVAHFAADGGYSFVAHTDSSYRFEIRDGGFQTPLFSSDTKSIDAAFYWSVSRDGGFLVRKIADGRSGVYRTGLASRMAAAAPAAEALIDVDSPPAAKTKPDPDAYALVIGVEKYRQDGIPAVDFAARDAETMAAYLTGAMGFDAKNVVLLTDSRATRTDFEKNLKWLSNRVDAKSRVFVYFAGHGSPNPETGQGYLMPYEADPAYLDETAFPIAKLYAALGKLPAKDVTVVLDACFSGQGKRSLIAKGTRPLVSVVQAQAEANTVVLSATGSNQVSASDPRARHGLLTYYLLAALRGEADARGDGVITADELYAYVKPAVERAAKLQNVEQTPNLMSPRDAVSRPWIELAPKK